jgi:streptogramin lyase
VPNTDPFLIVRDPDGEPLFEFSDPGKQGRNVAIGLDGEVAVSYRITAGSGSDPDAHQYIDLYDNEGVRLWSKRIFDAGEYPIEPAGASVRQMACDPDGNVFYVYGVGFETRFGKLDHITGAILFLQKDYNFDSDVPGPELNSGCTGICCDPDGDVIFTYASDAGERKIKKRSGATGASLWEVTGTNVHHSPRCDGDGNVFVSELIAPNARIKKLNGATSTTLL